MWFIRVRTRYKAMLKGKSAETKTEEKLILWKVLINVVCESQNYVNNLIFHSLHFASSLLISSIIHPQHRLMSKDPLKTTKFYRKGEKEKVASKGTRSSQHSTAQGAGSKRKICFIENVKWKRALRWHNFVFLFPSKKIKKKSPITLKVFLSESKHRNCIIFKRRRKILIVITCGGFQKQNQWRCI